MRSAVDIKHQVIASLSQSGCCQQATLSALIRTLGSLVLNRSGRSIVLAWDDPILAEWLATALNSRQLQIISGDGGLQICGQDVERLLDECAIMSRVRGEYTLTSGIAGHLVIEPCCRRAYIRGAFIGAGRASFGRSYFLEFDVGQPQLCQDLGALLAEFVDATPKCIVRRDRQVLSYRDSQAICDTLTLIGATRAMLAFSDDIVARMQSCDQNRALNCINANIDKMVTASLVHMTAIEQLTQQGVLATLDQSLRTTASARVEHPDYSLAELAELLGVSKTCVRHRLARLKQIADQLQK